MTYDFKFLFHNISRCLLASPWLEITMQQYTESLEVTVFFPFFLLFLSSHLDEGDLGGSTLMSVSLWVDFMKLADIP